jgi:spermidine synthase
VAAHHERAEKSLHQECADRLYRRACFNVLTGCDINLNVEDWLVIPWVHLDSAEMPGGGELRLLRRGAEFSIMLGRVELMNSRRSGSEGALATMSCERIQGRQQPRILIGGLGMGFTLRAALSALGKDARIIVAELAPAVIAWAYGPMAEVFGKCLEDPRINIHKGDVGALIKVDKASFDAILLDVDNGPEGITRKANNDIYSAEGLRAARMALRPGGVLAIWSSGPDREFTKRLNSTGFVVEEVAVRANGKRGGARHVIWLATNNDVPSANP